jgi:hypothetical protein
MKWRHLVNRGTPEKWMSGEFRGIAMSSAAVEVDQHLKLGSVALRPAEVRLPALLVTLDRLIRHLQHRQTAGAPVVGSFGPVVSAGS